MTKCFTSRAKVAGLILAVAAAIPTAAQAADGTITFAGELIDSTCLINGHASPSNFVVNLPRVAARALPATIGATAGNTVFEIRLTECPAAMTGNIRAHFELGPTVTDREKGWLHAYADATAAGSATTAVADFPADLNAAANRPLASVGIRLANVDANPISIGMIDSAAAAALADTVPATTPATRQATLRYLASYVRIGAGAVTSGRIVSYIQYSIHYP